jgi:hypothetical protein
MNRPPVAARLPTRRAGPGWGGRTIYCLRNAQFFFVQAA